MLPTWLLSRKPLMPEYLSATKALSYNSLAVAANGVKSMSTCCPPCRCSDLTASWKSSWYSAGIAALVRSRSQPGRQLRAACSTDRRCNSTLPVADMWITAVMLTPVSSLLHLCLCPFPQPLLFPLPIPNPSIREAVTAIL